MTITVDQTWLHDTIGVNVMYLEEIITQINHRLLEYDENDDTRQFLRNTRNRASSVAKSLRKSMALVTSVNDTEAAANQ